MEKMLSGIKPTGSITLGNYLGAIKPFVKYQDLYDLNVFVADMHSLTLPIDKNELLNNTENLIAIYLAAGLNPNKCTIFKQSDVLEHEALGWILCCNTNLSDLTNMPQYKNYISKLNADSGIPSGMLMYPTLMAADILLYDADYVPVGIDQKPHVELARDIAEKFNKKYPDTFKLPKSVFNETGAKIMSLTDPTKKMSKSESDKGTIYLLDDIEISKKKIMKAITDSENSFYYDPINKPGLSNLIVIYSQLENITIEEVVSKFKNENNYGVFKRALCDILEKELNELQTKVNKIKSVNRTIECILVKGSCKAQAYANKKLAQVYESIGIKK